MGIEAEQETYKGHGITIEYDEGAVSPREWSNLCEFHYNGFSLGCNLEDVHHTDAESVEEMLAIANKQKDIVMPLFCYEHGGTSLSLQSFCGRVPQGHCEFDSGQAGFVVIRRKKILDEFDRKTFSAKLKEKVMKIAECEVETFNNYLRGNVFGYIIDDGDGDSCWGYYSIEDAIEEAQDMIDHIVKQEKKIHFKQLKAWIKNKVPFQYRISAI